MGRKLQVLLQEFLSLRKVHELLINAWPTNPDTKKPLV